MAKPQKGAQTSPGTSHRRGRECSPPAVPLAVMPEGGVRTSALVQPSVCIISCPASAASSSGKSSSAGELAVFPVTQADPRRTVQLKLPEPAAVELAVGLLEL